MNIQDMMTEMKKHPQFHRAGMILCHNGVVRGTSRNGRAVTGVKIVVDRALLMEVIEKNKKRPGIVDIRVEIADNRELSVGEDIMLLAVAGDIRENVIAVLTDTLEAIKKTVTRKTESFT
jgi:molybdopterin synthase catalytic subunit